MKKILLVAFLMTICALSSLAQSPAVQAGKYYVLDTANGDVNGRWKKMYDYAVITSDSVNSTTTLTPIGGLTIYMEPNESSVFDFYATDSVSIVTTGIKYAYTIPSGATIRGIEAGSKPSQDSTNKALIIAGATAGAAFTLYVPTTNYGLYESHFLVTNGPTDGYVTVEFVKPTSGKAIVKAGSYLIKHRVSR